MKIKLVKANISHFDCLLPIVKKVNVMRTVAKGEVWSKFYLKKHLIQSEQNWREKKVRSFVYIILIDDKCAGYIRWRKKDSDNLFLLRIFVDDKYQGKGVGTKSLKLSISKIIGYFRDKYLYAETYKENLGAQKLLEKCGFSYKKDNFKSGKKLKVYRYDTYFHNFPYLKYYTKFDKETLFKLLQSFTPTIADNNTIHKYIKEKIIRKQLGRYDLNNFRKLGGNYLIIKMNYEKYKMLFTITDLFSEECRAKCKVFYSDTSPYDYYSKKENKEAIKKYLEDNSLAYIRKNIAKRLYEMSKECTLFKTTFVISVLKHFKPRSWLDMSAGWGDRLIGAIAYDIDYYCGIDPSECMNPVYHRIIDELAKDKKKYNIIKGCSEDVDLSKLSWLENGKKSNQFDLVFTSPPFFDFEVYNQEKTQSYHKFPNYHNWMKNFMFPSIKNGWNKLKKGKHFLLYIPYKNPVLNKKTKKYESLECFKPVNDYIINKMGGKFLGDIYFVWENLKIRFIYVWQKI